MRTSEARQGGAIHHTNNNTTAALAGPSPKNKKVPYTLHPPTTFLQQYNLSRTSGLLLHTHHHWRGTTVWWSIPPTTTVVAGGRNAKLAAPTVRYGMSVVREPVGELRMSYTSLPPLSRMPRLCKVVLLL